ncbi:persephin [Thunnus albacares]|uniref:persephin n=1 Tax=Thunnus maccoyii TaxID=8240 RepID=UPI001C4C720B|nr:persephin [Thunnus maccoyii]XP_044200877.1 persephin [Thunnus albacares]|eukprot:superscaffoldBa00005142_g19959
MRSLLKLVVILFCIQRGEGHWLRSLIDQKRETASHMSPSEDNKSRDPAEEDGQTETSGVGPSPDPIVPIPVRSRRSTHDSQCGLHSILLQVRDLGLGYDSDESVLFKYCSGTCPRVRSNHDLTLTNLQLSGVLPQPAPGELWHNAPCCRPSHHEDMAFLDNSHRWHKVEKLSAAGCSCVG